MYTLFIVLFLKALLDFRSKIQKCYVMIPITIFVTLPPSNHPCFTEHHNQMKHLKKNLTILRS